MITSNFLDQFPIVFDALNEGFLQTLKLFAITLLGALPLGLILSFGSMSKFKPLSGVIKTIVWIVRGSPLMIQLLIIYYFPGLVFGNNIWGSGPDGRFIASAVAFIINYSCYFLLDKTESLKTVLAKRVVRFCIVIVSAISFTHIVTEIYRGGIQGVPIGQQEAGKVLGLSKKQIFFKITLLQMIKRIVPPMSNEIITLVKDTSLARIIAMQELIWAGEAFLTGSRGISGQIWPLFFTAIYYLVFNGVLTILFGKIEKKLSYFKI